MSLVNMPNGRLDFLMSGFIVPSSTSTNTEMTFTDSTALLDFQADLQSAPPLRTGTGFDYTLEWSEVVNDVNGRPFDVLLGDQLLIVNSAPIAAAAAEAAA